MKLKLKRDRECNAKGCTFGRLYVDGVQECHTLEDVERKVKVHGETAIPVGVYKVVVTFSNRFQRMLPLLSDVPGFTGVRIHAGNSAKNTEGCVLVGDSRDVNTEWLGSSRIAFNRLFSKIQTALANKEEVTLEIV